MNLKLFKAKTDNTTIEQHNEGLYNILKQIIDIYDINKISNNLKNTIKYHDIGKCSESMQRILNNEKCNFIRHEWVSASVKDLSIPERLAILTHHKELSKSIELIDNDKYKEELKEVADKLNIELEDISDFVKQVNRTRNKDVKDLNNILLKGYLNYCDHLASSNNNITIDKGFNSLESFKFNNYNSIQRQALESDEDILITAMTGLGKTATSLYWSNNVQNKEKSKRIYYILPFTASINSLFKDFESKDISTSMLHSKSEYFMSKLDDDFSKDKFKLLKYSTKQLNICTIFQLAKAMFSCKRFEMLLAQMKNSIIIVDEIHCFDTKTLAYILELLKWLKDNLGVRICIMSASIPSCLQELIKDRLGITKVIKADTNDLIIRHRIHRKKATIFDDIQKIKNDLDNGKQVIICVNNVKTSQELYKLFCNDYQVKLIHGKFNTRDREIAEQGLKTNQLLIGTQAIEVSLDISYDVMYTEIATLDAGIQRFGRINRKGEKGICDIFIYDNHDKCIYKDELINNTDNVIKEMIKNDNSIVLEEKVNYYLDKVYTSVNLEEYNIYKNSLNKIINNLRLGSYNKSSTDDMVVSDTLSVIPVSLLSEYEEYINNKEYLKAQSLKVNMSANRLKWDENIRQNEEGEFICYYKYSSDIGLEFMVDKQHEYWV